jgi:hypothetical protein
MFKAGAGSASMVCAAALAGPFALQGNDSSFDGFPRGEPHRGGARWMTPSPERAWPAGSNRRYCLDHPWTHA